VKTRKFAADKYVGDPLNAVRIFNEKEVDELMVLDIDATRKGAEPNYDMISSLAAECRMPLCYGGGVRSVDQVRRIIGLGA
jgi:imidazole glycerol-phosphate synthase subunit HisF